MFAKKNYFDKKENLAEKILPKKLSPKKIITKNKLSPAKNLPKIIFRVKVFGQFFLLKELSWVDIKLTHNLGSLNLAFRLNSQK